MSRLKKQIDKVACKVFLICSEAIFIEALKSEVEKALLPKKEVKVFFVRLCKMQRKW